MPSSACISAQEENTDKGTLKIPKIAYTLCFLLIPVPESSNIRRTTHHGHWMEKWPRTKKTETKQQKIPRPPHQKNIYIYATFINSEL
jgi:hypothetical protein